VKALSADPDAKALAGGMTLIPVLKQRLNKPSVVVDLAKLGLVGVSVSGNTVTISGMTTHGAVAGEKQETLADQETITLLQRFAGDPDVQKAGGGI
jgi:carbon-monoxide dehydrogenase medium subunit